MILKTLNGRASLLLSSVKFTLAAIFQITISSNFFVDPSHVPVVSFSEFQYLLTGEESSEFYCARLDLRDEKALRP